jgi:UPF0755 protein
VVVVLIIVVLLAGVAGGFLAYENSLKAVDPLDGAEITIEIPEGTPVDGIAKILKENGLIKNVFFFKFYVNRSGSGGDFRQGSFALTKAMPVGEIVTKLTTTGSAAASVKFTIPEGYNIVQIKNRLVENGIVTEEAFMEEIRNGEFDYRFLADCPPGDERLEGFLYPDTYEVFEGEDAHSVIGRMLENFDSKFKDEYYTRAEERGISVRDAVTMGSIIERESKAPEERPVMAAVFYNRLDTGMKLESCATVQYILGEPKEILTYDDIAIDSPYNTYIYSGLPPGPICNPRMASIEAALYPDSNDYIFFVLSPALDGTHNFSVDYDDFLDYKAEYENAIANR